MNHSSNIIHLAGRSPSALATRLHGPECKKDHALINGLRPPYDLSAVSSQIARSLVEETTSRLLTSRTAWVWNVVLEISKSFTFFLICLFGGLVITGAVLSPFIYLSFFRLH